MKELMKLKKVELVEMAKELGLNVKSKDTKEVIAKIIIENKNNKVKGDNNMEIVINGVKVNMKMKKAELINIAESLGIYIEEGYTKAEIIKAIIGEEDTSSTHNDTNVNDTDTTNTDNNTSNDTTITDDNDTNVSTTTDTDPGSLIASKDYSNVKNNISDILNSGIVSAANKAFANAPNPTTDTNNTSTNTISTSVSDKIYKAFEYITKGLNNNKLLFITDVSTHKALFRILSTATNENGPSVILYDYYTCKNYKMTYAVMVTKYTMILHSVASKMFDVIKNPHLYKSNNISIDDIRTKVNNGMKKYGDVYIKNEGILYKILQEKNLNGKDGYVVINREGKKFHIGYDTVSNSALMIRK